MKPLYKFEQQLRYRQHKSRLNLIKARCNPKEKIGQHNVGQRRTETDCQETSQQLELSPSHEQLVLSHFHSQSNEQLRQLQAYISMHSKSMKHEVNANKKMIASQNQRLLQRLISISTKDNKNDRINPAYHYRSHSTKRQTPYRKKWLSSIQKQNEGLLQRLQNSKSMFDSRKAQKSQSDYERVKKTMRRNKCVKVTADIRQQSVDFQLPRIPNALVNHRPQIARCASGKSEVSNLQCITKLFKDVDAGNRGKK